MCSSIMRMVSLALFSVFLVVGCAEPGTRGPLADRPSFNGCIPIPAGGQLFINSLTLDPNEAEGSQEMTIEAVRSSHSGKGVLEASAVLVSAEEFTPGFLVPSGDAFFEGLEFTELPAIYSPEGGVVAVGVLVQFEDDVVADGSEPVLTTTGVEYRVESLGTFAAESHRSVWLTSESVESDGFCAAYEEATR